MFEIANYLPVVCHTEGPVYPGILCTCPCWQERAESEENDKIEQRLLLESKAQHWTVCYLFQGFWYGYNLVSPGPFNLGSEVLHSLVQTSVTAQLRLHRGKIRAPLGFIKAMLVLLHPGQEVLDIAKGHIVQLRPHLHGGLLGGLCQGNLGGGHCRLQTKVVVTAQVHQALMEAVNPVEMTYTVGC